MKKWFGIFVAMLLFPGLSLPAYAGPHHPPHHPHGPVVRVFVGHPAPPPPVVIAEPVVVERTVVVKEAPPVVVEEPAPAVVWEAEPAPVTKPDVLSAAYFENQKNRMNDLFRNESPTVRVMAAEQLADQTPILAALIDAMINDADERVRGAAARSLGKLANPIACAALKQSARYEEDEAVRDLSEATATGEPSIQQAEEKLAKFLCRIQIPSEIRPELDGGFYRGFDFSKWDYWASDADVGWGVWCIESGWTQAWITSVLGLRQMKTSLWDIICQKESGAVIRQCVKKMIPGT